MKHVCRTSVCLALLIAVWLLLDGARAAHGQSATAPAEPNKLVLLTGETIELKTLTIDEAGNIHGEGIPDNLTLDDVRRIERSGIKSPKGTASGAVIDLAGGGRILAKDVTIADDQCRIAWPHGGGLVMPIDSVRAIRLDAQRQDAEFDKALALPGPNVDRLFLKVAGEQLERIGGLVESLSATTLSADIGGQSREIPRERVYGIVVAQPAVESSPPRCQVTLADGSTLGGESLRVQDGQATLTMATNVSAKFPWEAVAEVAVRSKRAVFLSDLKPVSEEHQPIVTLPRPWQRDKSVSGGALAVGDQVFEKGIGVHARSSLAFDAGGQYDVLAATIGLDSSGGERGDCVFVVEADGERVFSRRMRGTDPPQAIEVPIRGRKQITLLVEPGEALDLGDHANWCEAQFIKNK